MAQNPLGAARAPAQDRLRQLVAEITPVEPGEEFVQVVNPSDGAGQHLAAALLPGQVSRALHLWVVSVLAVQILMLSRHTLVIEFRDEDECERAMHRGRSVTHNVRDAHIYALFAYANCMVKPREGIKSH